MIGIFKQKSPANPVLLLIFGLLIKLPLFFDAKNVIASPSDGKLYHWLLQWIASGITNNGTISAVISFGLIYVQALIINHFINEHRMTTKQNFLPALSYILITSLSSEWSYLSAPLIASTFIILSLVLLLKLYNKESAKGTVYNMGLLLGIASFFYLPSAAFIVWVLIGLLILHPIRINEFVLLLFGLTTPYYFYLIYLYLNNNLSWSSIIPPLSIHIPSVKSSLWLAISVLLLTVPFLVGAYYVQTHLRKMLIQVRKNWSVVLLYLLFALTIPFINSSDSLVNWVLALAPFAAFHGCCYLYPPSKVLSLVLFFSTVAFIIFQQYVTNLW